MLLQIEVNKVLTFRVLLVVSLIELFMRNMKTLLRLVLNMVTFLYSCKLEFS